MIIEMKQHHFTPSNEKKYAYTFNPYKQQRNVGGHCHGYSVLFGKKILNLPSISVGKNCFNWSRNIDSTAENMMKI